MHRRARATWTASPPQRHLVVVAGVVAVATSLLSGCGGPSTAPASIHASRTHGGVTVTLALATDRVVAGTAIPATLTIVNRTTRTFDVGCAADGTFSIGLGNARVRYSPAMGAVACATRVAPGTFVQHTEIETTYNGCGGGGVPVCQPGPDPIPALPSGRYHTVAPWQGVPAAIPAPPPLAVTVAPLAPSLVLASQLRWRPRLTLPVLAVPTGALAVGTAIIQAAWASSLGPTSCDRAVCWSTVVAHSRVYLVRGTHRERGWRVASGPIGWGVPVSAPETPRWPRPTMQALGHGVVAIVGIGPGLLVTMDGGASWRSSRFFADAVSVARSATGGLELTAAAFPGSAVVRVYRSTNGISWELATLSVLPNLTGMPLARARLLASVLGLHLRATRVGCCAVEPVETPYPPFGSVWSQAPRPYRVVGRGSTVTVYVGMRVPGLE